MKRKFIAGEIACLKLEDGPEMIVEKIVENPYGGTENYVQCVWFKNDKLMRDIFPIFALRNKTTEMADAELKGKTEEELNTLFETVKEQLKRGVHIEDTDICQE